MDAWVLTLKAHAPYSSGALTFRDIRIRSLVPRLPDLHVSMYGAGTLGMRLGYSQVGGGGATSVIHTTLYSKEGVYDIKCMHDM